MATFQSIIEECERLLRRGTSIRTDIRAALAAAVDHYKDRRFAFNELKFSFTTTANDDLYDDTDADEIPYITKFDSVVLSSGTAWSRPLVKIDNAEIESAGPNVASSTPTHFAYVREQIRLYPPPSTAGWTVTVEGVRELLDGSTPPVPLNAETAQTFPLQSELDWFSKGKMVVMTWAIGYINFYVFRNSPEAQANWGAADAFADKLAGRGQSVSGTDTLTPTRF